MGEIIDLAGHDKARGHPLQVARQLSRVEGEIFDLHERLKFNQQAIDTLEEEIRALAQLRKAVEKRTGQIRDRGGRLQSIFSKMGFSIDTSQKDARVQIEASIRDAAKEGRQLQADLRLKQQERERLLKAVKQKMDEKERLDKKLSKDDQ